MHGMTDPKLAFSVSLLGNRSNPMTATATDIGSNDSQFICRPVRPTMKTYCRNGRLESLSVSSLYGSNRSVDIHFGIKCLMLRWPAMLEQENRGFSCGVMILLCLGCQ